MIERVAILGTGLIGASVGLALKEAGFAGEIAGWDKNAAELALALERGAIDRALTQDEAALRVRAAGSGLGDFVRFDLMVLATPVLPILEWMEVLAPGLGPGTLVTDVGSTKAAICAKARGLFGGAGQGRFLPGHPMAGKESGGAALAEATLFRGAAWLFTPIGEAGAAELEWRGWVERMGARVSDMEADRHDELCAWVSHLPQMLSTALAALLEETFAGDPEGMAAVGAIGGRALRETTRLGASPYSMWRDVALTNTENVAATLLALEQRLQHLREHLRGPELREEFRLANGFQGAGKT